MKTFMDYKDFFFVAISFSQNNKFFLDIIKHVPHSHDVIISNVPYDTSAKPLYLFVEAAHYTVGSKHITERSDREDYQIILTVSGGANVIYDDKEYVLSPNSAILIDCRKYHKYFLKKAITGNINTCILKQNTRNFFLIYCLYFKRIVLRQ